MLTRILGGVSAAFFVVTLAVFPAGAAVGAAVSNGPTSPTLVNWNLTPEDIKANCAAEIARAKAATDAILAPKVHRTFRNTVLPLESMSADLNDRLAGEGMLAFVSTNKAVRSASFACQNDAGNFGAELSARVDLYRALQAAKRSNTAKTAADRKLLAYWLTSSIRSGAGLPEAQRREFVRLSQKLNELGNKFGENLGNDATTITITAEQAAVLPPDLVATFKVTPAGDVVPVNESTSTRFLQNEKDAAARREFWLAYNNRETQQNLPILQEAIATRDRLAHLMGYPNWAAYVLADRMARTPQRVLSFLQDLDAKLLPKARADLATLAVLKARDAGTAAATIEPWDVVYYDNMLRQSQYSVDENEVRQYFPAEHTINAVLAIYSKVLSVNYTPVVPATGPNPDVLEYSVSDKRSGRFIGTFYLDLYPRPGKYSHFANFPFLPARRMPDGTMRPPVAMIIGNWPQPAPGKPSLLSHGDVETFFHEFGHNMAALLATAPYETLSGGFRRDFVEAPSQMLENWVWNPQILKELSSNVTTGAPLPDDLIHKMIAARYVNDAYFTTRQIMLALIDMKYHTSGPSVDTTGIWQAVAREVTPLPVPAGVHPEASFGHLFGYDAGYYGYLWSKVYAQDMFTAFEKGGLESPVVGMRYRKYILEPAQTYEPDVLVRHFLGRPMSPNAFYREFGITPRRN